MLYHLLYPLHNLFSFFNIFRYITFRASMATLTAFLFALLVGPGVIRLLKRWQIGEKVVKEDSAHLDTLHSKKIGTPTMGGILIIISVMLAVVLWADIFNPYVLLAAGVMLWLGITGFFDDYLKQIKKPAKGISARAKLLSQMIVGLLVGVISVIYLWQQDTFLDVPFLKNVFIDLGIFYIVFAALVITASSNAVNLTDGLDGLAIGCVVMAAIALAVLSYVSGNVKLSQYLFIPYLRGSGELTIFCASIVGAGLGFLWFNCHPAQIFMGDVGSLALGGALGAVAVMIKKELLLVIIGGVFVMEVISVILQVFSFKLTGKRLFKISPLHHHFEFINWHENKVIVRFWILAAMFTLFTLVTLKIR